MEIEKLISVIADYGIAGVCIALLAFFIHRLYISHREERAEWLKAITQDSHETREVIKEFTRALHEIQGKINNK